MTEQNKPSTPATGVVPGAAVSHAAVGPLSVRDLMVLASVAIIFVASVVPLVSTIAGSFNLWNTGSLFYIGIGVVLPLAVGGLFLARRLSPGSKVRIGSLSIDQFASVVASFATFFFFVGTVTNFGPAYLIGLIGSLVMLAGTVCAQWIPVLASDFAGRAEVPAHVAARDAVPAVKRPAAPKPVVATAPNAAGAGAGAAVPFGAGGAQPGQGAPDASAQGAQSGQAVPGAPTAWAPAAASGHTAAGQIFTPAKENAAGAAATQSFPATGAGAGTGAATGADAGAAASSTGSAAAGTAAGSTKVPAAAQNNSAPQAAAPSATASSPVVPSQAATVSAATAPATVEAAQPAEPAAAVVPSPDVNATTLNPQVAPAKEQAAPVKASIAATVRQQAPAVAAEPFWFAVDRPQNVIDEKTRQFMFKLTPGAWILALEDRGSSFLVQDSRGKTGVLLDLVGIERAADSQ